MAKLLTGTRIYGTGTVDTQLFVNGTEQAVSTTTGALEVIGGAGIGGNLHLGGISVSAGVQTTNIVASGTLGVTGTTTLTVLNATSATFSGTLGVTGTSVLNGLQVSNIVASGTLGVTGTSTLAGITLVTNTTSATSITTGALVVSGGVGIGQDLRVGGVIYGTFNGAVTGTATNAINISGGTVGQVPYQTAPGTTSFYGPGTAGNVLVSNGAAAPSYNNTLTLTGTTAATSTATGALQVRGGVGIGGDIWTAGRIVRGSGIEPSGQLHLMDLIGANGEMTVIANFQSLSAGNQSFIAFRNPLNTGDTILVGSEGANLVLRTGNTTRLTVDNLGSVIISSTSATISTTTGALQVVGGVGIGGNLFLGGNVTQVGGTYSTLAATYNLINTTATTVNFAGAATSLNVGATSGSTNVRNNLIISGNLTVQGTTTIVDSTVTNIADPIITLGGGSGNNNPTTDDNKDRGVAFKWVNNGGTTSTGFFGYDDSTGFLTYIQTATITNEVVSGTKGAVDANLAGGTAMSIVYQSAANTTAFLAAGSSGFILQTNGTSAAPTWVSSAGIGAGSATNSDAIRTIERTTNGNHFLTFVDSNNATNAYESLYTTSSFVVNPATGYIGMGTASPQRPLHVVSMGTTIQGIAAFEANASGFVIQDNGSQNGNVELVGYKQTSSTYHNILIRGSSSGLLVQNTTGNVGLGNLTPIAKLHIGAEIEPNMSSQSLFVQGSKTGYAGFKGLPQGQLLIYDDTASTAGSGGAIGFGANTGASQRTWIASINSERDSATNDATNYAGSLVFYTRPAQATPEERVRITSTGSVGIGTNSPLSRLDVVDTVTAVAQRIRTTSIGSTNVSLRIQDGATGFTTGDGIYLGRTGADATNYLWTYENEPWVFATNNTERIRITSAGGVAFGGSTNYGSSGFVLKSNGDAAPTWVDPSTLASAGATNADNIRTVARTTAAAHYLTFVDSNNAANAYESLYTTSSFQITPSTGNIQIGMTGQDYQPSSGGNHTLRLNALNTSSIGFHDSGSTIANIKFSGAYGFEIGAYDGLYGPHNTILHGSVGVGTQNPTAKFTISNTGSTSAAFYADIGNPGSAITLFEHTGASTPVPFRFRKSGYSGASPNFGLFYLHMNDGTVGNGSNLYFNLNNSSGTEIEYGGLGAIIRSNTAASEQGDLALYVMHNGTGRTERMRITSAGAIAFNGASSYGSSGQVLQSNGNAPPTWINQSSITSGGTSLTSTYVGFGSGSNLLTGSANLTYASSILNVAYQNTFNTTTPGTGQYGIHLNGQTTNDSATGITFSAGGSNAGNAHAGIYSQGSGSYGTRMYFATTDSYAVGSKTRVMINELGNVGIGITSPSGRLHLYQTAGGSNTLTLDTNFVNGNAFAINPFITGISNGGLSIRDVNNSADRLVIQYSTGNVGIGTTAPDSRLHVEVGNATAYTPVNTLVSGQTARISNTDGTSGVSANLLFVAKGAGGGNGLGSISGVNTGVGSLALTFGTRHSSSNVIERMRVSSDGNVGIGTSNPINKFEISGDSGQLFSVSDSFTGTIFSANDVSGIPSIEVLDTGLVKFAQYNGAVTIGTGTVSSSTAELSVYGMLYTSGPQGEIRASNEITAYFSSDARLKENIKLIENPITIIDQIRGVTFDWTEEHMARRGGEDGYFVRKHDIGVIAQEVQAVLPELVGTREDGYLAVKYEKMVPLLIEAIKEQQKTIDTLTSEIKEIKEFLSSLKNN